MTLERRGVLLGLAGAVGVAALSGTARAAKGQARASVRGPVQGGRRGRPFGSLLESERPGYLEEEYFLSGTGTAFLPVGELGTDGKWTVKPAKTAPFKTRLLVRRPADPAQFNGTVIVEWLNVTAGFELGTVRPDPLSGFAYVGVSAQKAGVHGLPRAPQGLTAWDPDRYGTLFHGGDSISYDVLSQAGRAVGPNRPAEGVDPLGELKVRKVIATGASQSAARLLTYLNAIHPRDRVFDAFVPVIGSGWAAGFDDALLDPASLTPQLLAQLFRVSARVRADLSVPTLALNSESETLRYYAVRQPDTDRFRYWEIAGAAHAPAPFGRTSLSVFARDGVATPVLTDGGSNVDWVPTLHAAFRHVHGWINGEGAPPSFAPIAVSGGAEPAILLDAHGNAVGGLRLPEMEVPVARYSGSNGKPGLAGLSGVTERFPPAKLKQLYPTRADYAAKVEKAARAAEAAGAILPERTRQYIAEAQTAPIV